MARAAVAGVKGEGDERAMASEPRCDSGGLGQVCVGGRCLQGEICAGRPALLLHQARGSSLATFTGAFPGHFIFPSSCSTLLFAGSGWPFARMAIQGRQGERKCSCAHRSHNAGWQRRENQCARIGNRCAALAGPQAGIQPSQSSTSTLCSPLALEKAALHVQLWAGEVESCTHADTQTLTHTSTHLKVCTCPAFQQRQRNEGLGCSSQRADT